MSKPSPSTVAPAYGQLVARGMAWTTGGVLVGRVTGFVAQLILGWLLSKNDFGIYAIAFALSVLVFTLRNSGVHRLLIQRGAEYDQLARPMAMLSGGINLLGMLALWLAAPFAVSYYQEPAIGLLMWLIGLSMPLAVPADILRARLSVDLRFRDLAILNTVVLTLTQALTVTLALCGLGPLSFVIPTAVMAVVESLVLWWTVGGWPTGRRLNWALTRELLTAAKWIILCGIAAALAVQGAHLVVGKMKPREVTGIVYFGFQLSAAVAMFINASMYRVLMPTFSRLASQPQRCGEAYIKSLRVLATAVAPACGLIAVLAGPVIHFCWQGKWDSAIQVFRPLAVVLPITMMSIVSTSALEARGLWRANAMLHFLAAAATLVGAWLGATWGGLFEIALSVAFFRASIGVVQGVAVTRLFDRPARAYLWAVLPPCMIVAIAAWLAVELNQRELDGPTRIGPWVLPTTAYLALTAVAYGLLLRDRLPELGQMLRSLRGPRSQTADQTTGR